VDSSLVSSAEARQKKVVEAVRRLRGNVAGLVKLEGLRGKDRYGSISNAEAGDLGEALGVNTTLSTLDLEDNKLKVWAGRKVGDRTGAGPQHHSHGAQACIKFNGGVGSVPFDLQALLHGVGSVVSVFAACKHGVGNALTTLPTPPCWVESTRPHSLLLLGGEHENSLLPLFYPESWVPFDLQGSGECRECVCLRKSNVFGLLCAEEGRRTQFNLPGAAGAVEEEDVSACGFPIVESCLHDIKTALMTAKLNRIRRLSRLKAVRARDPAFLRS
jgi:hypothetical protein